MTTDEVLAELRSLRGRIWRLADENQGAAENLANPLDARDRYKASAQSYSYAAALLNPLVDKLQSARRDGE